MINVFNQQKSGVLLKWGFEKRSKVQQSFFKMETLAIAYYLHRLVLELKTPHLLHLP